MDGLSARLSSRLSLSALCGEWRSPRSMADWLSDLPEPDVLRYYQRDAKEASEQALARGENCIIVMATGLGKTICSAAMVRDWSGSVLWLTHRDELIWQSKAALEKLTGEVVDVEQGPCRARPDARIVVGSLDTVRRQKRLDRFGPDRFSLIVTDEVHIALAATYKKTIEFFNAKRFGMTATADRLDGRSLGALFDTVAYKMDIREGIDAGYLVPISARMVELKEIDVSNVSTSAGDLAVGQLDEAMLKACGGIVEETLRLEPDRTGIVFAPGVKSAQLIHQLLVARGKSACFVSAKTPTDERRQLVEDFREGRTQYLVNCQVATTGFDAPACSLIVMARPTKSRLLYTQMGGRGTRTAPGTVEPFMGRADAALRRAAIAASSKPDMVILDFAGNCGRHSLVSAVDLLGGSYTDAEVKQAKRRVVEGTGDIQQALESARAELRRIAQAAQVAATSVVTEVDPFGVFHIHMDEALGMREPCTEGQRNFLRWMGLSEKEARAMSKREAGKMISTARVRREKGLADYKQLRELREHGVDKVAISSQRADTVLRYLRATKRAGNIPDKNTINELLRPQRQEATT